MEENSLVIVPPDSNITVFKNLQPFIDKVKGMVDHYQLDLQTPTGRKDCISFANKITRSKTYLAAELKKIVDPHVKEIELVKREGKRMEDEFDKMKFQIRNPLSILEQEEKDCHEKIMASIQEIKDLKVIYRPVGGAKSIPEIKENLEKLMSYEINETWGVLRDIGEQHRTEGVAILSQYINEIERLEAEKKAKAEAERLEREHLERERQERERIEAEKNAEVEKLLAEQQAKIDAFQKAETERLEKERQAQQKLEAEKAEAERLERERLERERQERERIEAEKNAEIEAERIEAQRLEAIEAAAAKRKADNDHRQNICAAMACELEVILVELMSKNLSTLEVCAYIVEAIKENKLKHISINF